MKKVLKLLSFGIVIAALAGGVVLVKNIQDTRKGAYFANVNVSVLPDTKSLITGEEFTAKIMVIAGDKKVSGVSNFKLIFDKSILSVKEGSLVINPKLSTGLLSQIKNSEGTVNFTGLVAGGEFLTGTFELAAVKFVAIGPGQGKVNLDSGAQMVGFNPAGKGIDDYLKMDFTEAVYTVAGEQTGFTKADLVFVPPLKTVELSKQEDGSIILKSGNTIISAVRMTVAFDKTKIEISDLTTNSGFDNKTGTEIDNANGELKINLFSTKQENERPKGDIKVASFKVKGKAIGKSTLTVGSNYQVVGVNSGSDNKRVDLNLSTGEYNVLSSGETTDWPTLNFKFAFTGIVNGAKCAVNWPVAVMVRSGDGTSKTYSGIIPTVTGEEANGLAVYRATLKLEGITQKSGLAVFIKGQKHAQVKYGVDGQKEFYNQAGGQVDVNDNNKIYDFSGYPLLAGDVTGEVEGTQDGVVDGRDFSYVKRDGIERKRIEEGGNLNSDLDGNCLVSATDITSLMVTLKERQEQLY